MDPQYQIYKIYTRLQDISQQITIWDDRITVELKSGVNIDVDV